MNQKDVLRFLDLWFSEINKSSIDVTGLPLDHVGYSVSSSKEYDGFKKKLLKQSKFIREHIISGRRVSVFKFSKPYSYKNYSVSALELIEPKAGEVPRTGFEHAEFTTKDAFEKIAEKYPNLTWDMSNIGRPDFPRLKLVLQDGTELKFNHTPILVS